MSEPIHGKRYVPGEPPPRDHILMRVVDGGLSLRTGPDEKGALIWVRPDDTRGAPDKVSVIPAALRTRIRKIAQALWDYDDVTGSKSVTQWVNGFARDRHPEREVLVWEAIVCVFQTEVALRPQALPRERDLLLKTLVYATAAAYDIENVLSAFPRAKALPYLARALNDLRALIAP